MSNNKQSSINWDDGVYKNYKSKTEIMMGHGFHGTLLSQEEFINRIKTDDEFAKTWGDLGYTNDIEKNKSQTMTNNKQSMKLYTEEQVRNLLNEILMLSSSVNDAMDSLTPIELPSDEEIRKIMELDDMEFDEFDPYHLAHLEGAKWMRDKIQGGNK